DPSPSPTEHCYTITAVDKIGNKSEPCDSFYLNFQLLPVASVSVVVQDNDFPVLSWTHPGGDIIGYDIYVGPVKLNTNPVTGTSFTDTGYAGDERTYTIIGLDANLVESPARSITLPVLNASLISDSVIKRGLMNRLTYQVNSTSLERVNSVAVKVDIESHTGHASLKINLDPGESRAVDVAVGGYEDLPDVATLTTTMEQTPNMGETIRIIKTSEIEVLDGMMILQIQNNEFTRGATGSVRFTLENPGDEEIEIVTATNSGNSASNEITWKLLDSDNNVLSFARFHQNIGTYIVAIPDGRTVARIPAGAIFTSEYTDIPVPSNAPDDVTVALSIGNIHHNTAKTGYVQMDGLTSTRRVSLMDTSYYGIVTDISPRSSQGDEDIIITGLARDRANDAPLPDVSLTLVITVHGFERLFDVATDENGEFTHAFTPLAGESGRYTVAAIHPDLLDRPEQDEFVITR
ncbi:MAG: hypothetical protein KAI90_07495, partial [Desulfobulbaceae bacterium]|nr:hypothetical protein [Desulfobulbaceae bacterium]